MSMAVGFWKIIKAGVAGACSVVLLFFGIIILIPGAIVFTLGFQDGGDR